MPSQADSFARRTAMPIALAAAQARTFDARTCHRITVLAHAGATVTWSRVDTHDASAHGTGTERTITPPAAEAAKTIDVDWPFYRVSTAGGAATVAFLSD